MIFNRKRNGGEKMLEICDFVPPPPPPHHVLISLVWSRKNVSLNEDK